MQSINVVRESSIKLSPRVLQIQSMFDIQAETARMEWNVDLDLSGDWNVGLIVGPSGAGKSTIAKELFGENLVTQFEWDGQKAVIDGFPKAMATPEIVSLLTSVGFGSAVNWLTPFHCLSNGEQFRVTMARALAESSDLVVVDEFTSVVDRQVAKTSSHSIQKAVRSQGRKFVAVGCHYDVIDWLQPDWIYQPHTGEFQRRLLRRRPNTDLQIFQVDRSAWGLFKRYHYLSAELSHSATSYGAFIDGQCVGFCAYVHFPHPKTKNIKHIHRLVVHPDYQGLGIGSALVDWVGQKLSVQGFKINLVTAHPGMLKSLAKSKRWRLDRYGQLSKGSKKNPGQLASRNAKFSATRNSATFVFCPEKIP